MDDNHINLAGLKIGHATDPEYHTGCTVFLCPPETVGSVDARGPAPGSRELTLLELDKPIQFVNAVLLTGGSAFGLAAADGVMRYLGEQNIGHWTPIRPIPIVPAAVVYDLFFSGGQRMPDVAMGYAACLDAREQDIAQGNVGAGTGVTVGKWGGRDGFMKGGFGLACVAQEGVVVGAAAVVNAVGDVVNEDGTVLAGARRAEGGWLVAEKPYRPFAARPPAQLTNTTLVVVWTNARLTKVEANRLAQRAHDGLAIAIRPVHTTHDGDTAFALATGQVETNFDLVANTAVHVTAEAIRNSVRLARSVGGVPGLGG
jgi:L-aminopeptidase/D-esterase-like protein